MMLTAMITFLSVTIMIIAALGILRLSGALSRQHAATKAATLSVGLFAIALMVHALSSGWTIEWVIKPLILMVILLITLPLAAHALGRSAHQEQRFNEAIKLASKNAK